MVSKVLFITWHKLYQQTLVVLATSPFLPIKVEEKSIQDAGAAFPLECLCKMGWNNSWRIILTKINRSKNGAVLILMQWPIQVNRRSETSLLSSPRPNQPCLNLLACQKYAFTLDMFSSICTALWVLFSFAIKLTKTQILPNSQVPKWLCFYKFTIYLQLLSLWH